MTDLERLKKKARYHSHWGLLFDTFSKIGIHIRPYYYYRVLLEDWGLSEDQTKECPYQLRYLEAEEMKVLERFPGRHRFKETKLLKRLEQGERCVGVFDGDKLICFSWHNLEASTFKPHQFKLKDEEVYLFDTYTDPDYRGKGVGLYAFAYVHELLQAKGKKYGVSFIEYVNRPSIALKEKTKGRPVSLHFYLSLLHRWHFMFRIKKYHEMLSGDFKASIHFS